MAIYRGEGGPGDATGDATNEAVRAIAAANEAEAAALAAQTSQTAAATSATNAANSATTASTQATAAGSSATSAGTSASSAASSAAAALVSKTAAETAETNASGSASAASTSSTNAANSASSASTSASDANSSKIAAQSAQTAAESARDATLAAYDQFDDRYLGSKTSDPTLDNDGNALIAGALYFNSVSGIMKLYTGSAWVAAYVQGIASGVGFTPAGNISAVNVQAAIEELDSEKLATTTIGNTVQAWDTDLDWVSANITTAGKALLDDANNTAQRVTLGLVIGTDVQAYDVDTAKTDVAQTFTASQRGTQTTDNDLSFDLNVTNNFICTPAATGTLTFTNLAAGQSGYVLLINTGGYSISKAASVKAGATFLTTVSTAGTYLISYLSNGTSVYVTASGALS